MKKKQKFGDYNYTITTHVPPDYSMWQIGNSMESDEYIPFCKCVKGSTHSVDTSSLLAVKFSKDTVSFLRYATSYGLDSVTACDYIIENGAKARYPHLDESVLEKIDKMAIDVKKILEPVYNN